MMQTSIAVLADPNRFRIVELLRTGPRPVNDIAERLTLNQPQVSKHLKVLKDAGWVEVEAQAQQRVYELSPAPLREMAKWLERYRSIWDARLSAMDDVIDELVAKEKSTSKNKKGKHR